jgi:hypothetical protein
MRSPVKSASTAASLRSARQDHPPASRRSASRYRWTGATLDPRVLTASKRARVQLAASDRRQVGAHRHPCAGIGARRQQPPREHNATRRVPLREHEATLAPLRAHQNRPRPVAARRPPQEHVVEALAVNARSRQPQHSALHAPPGAVKAPPVHRPVRSDPKDHERPATQTIPRPEPLPDQNTHRMRRRPKPAITDRRSRAPSPPPSTMTVKLLARSCHLSTISGVCRQTPDSPGTSTARQHPTWAERLAGCSALRTPEPGGTLIYICSTAPKRIEHREPC